MNPSKLVASTMTFRTYPLERALEALARAGFEQVELCTVGDWVPHFDVAHATDRSIAECAAAFRRTGMRAAAVNISGEMTLEQMENGYATQVNERGSRLSAGQRQLISFARALLADPKILILDEATSSIDTETELLLQQGLNELLKGRTSFLIAHRLSTIKNADCIMYIDHGGIVERGTHDELMEKKGEYYKLHMSQFDFLVEGK